MVPKLLNHFAADRQKGVHAVTKQLVAHRPLVDDLDPMLPVGVADLPVDRIDRQLSQSSPGQVVGVVFSVVPGHVPHRAPLYFGFEADDPLDLSDDRLLLFVVGVDPRQSGEHPGRVGHAVLVRVISRFPWDRSARLPKPLVVHGVVGASHVDLARLVTERRVALGAPHLIAALRLVNVDRALWAGTRLLHDHLDRLDHVLVTLVLFLLLGEALLADLLLTGATDPLARVHEAVTLFKRTRAVVDHLGRFPSPSVTLLERIPRKHGAMLLLPPVSIHDQLRVLHKLHLDHLAYVDVGCHRIRRKVIGLEFVICFLPLLDPVFKDTIQGRFGINPETPKDPPSVLVGSRSKTDMCVMRT